MRPYEPTKTFSSKQEVVLFPVQTKFCLKRPDLYLAFLAEKFGIYFNFQNTFSPILLTIINLSIKHSQSYMQLPFLCKLRYENISLFFIICACLLWMRNCITL